MEGREARADRWLEAVNARIASVEPEWWVRMQCGQLAEERSAAHDGGLQRPARQAEKQSWQLVRALVRFAFPSSGAALPGGASLPS